MFIISFLVHPNNTFILFIRSEEEILSTIVKNKFYRYYYGYAHTLKLKLELIFLIVIML